MNWYLAALKKYAVFSGRARRKEYWMFVLFTMIFSFAAAILDNVFGIVMGDSGYGPISILYSLFIFIPSVSVGVRRLHDIGKSGWFLLVSLIPVAGFIWILVLLCTDGKPEENAYGANPKAAA